MRWFEGWKTTLPDGTACGGEDILFDPAFEALQAEVNKNDGLQPDMRTDWGLVLEMATNLLSTRVKDLWVFCYGCRAVYEQSGISGLSAAIEITTHYVATCWDELYPPATRAARRAAPFLWLASKLEILMPAKAFPVEKQEAYDAFRQALQALQDELGNAWLAARVGQEADVLLEGRSPRDAADGCGESWQGRDAYGALVHVPLPAGDHLGRMVRVRIEHAHRHSLVGAVSEETAIQMADGVRRLTHSGYAFSITGVAGPAESERKKVGTVCFGFSSAQRGSAALTLHFSSWGRDSVRRRSVIAALILSRIYIEGGDVVAAAASWAAL